MTVLITGCTPGGKAYGLSAADVAGEWHALLNQDLTVRLNEDGSFTTESWPSRLYCEMPAASKASAYLYAEGEDLSGEWTASFEGDSAIFFAFDAPPCQPSSFQTTVMRDADRLAICLNVRPGADPDSIRQDEQIMLVRNEDLDWHGPVPCGEPLGGE
ncbi:hypothetical protein [Microbacterium hydrothermale]|uniref:hypothetical protein n=1 Tax=Microbacterium hydrothermale TaxID=857427 RepID=UPI002226E80C|nr:hypothetical protein [Microbacterium hydrothermale]